jgi:hypothetical protein
MSTEVLTIDVQIVEKGKEIFSALSELRPEKSFSFVLTEEGVEAVQEAKILAEWGIGGNKPKLKVAAMECFDQMAEAEAGSPVNVNFTEYELKAMAEVLSVIERALERQEDGILKK